MKYYPALLNLKGTPVLVVGGGRVALRKIRVLRACGAAVRVVATNVLSEARKLRGLHIQERAFRIPDLKGVQLVVAATSSRETNRKVSDACRRRGLFVNVVDDPEISTFILPAVVRRGDLLISVSTQGAAPFISAGIARELRERYGKGHALWVNKMRAARKKILRKVESPEKRKKLFRELLKPAYFRMIERGELGDFEKRVRRLIDEAR